MILRFDLRWWKNFKKKTKSYFTEVGVSDGRKTKYYKIRKVIGTRYKDNKYLGYVLENPFGALIALIPHLVMFLVGTTVASEIGKVLNEQNMWNPAPLMEIILLIVAIVGFISSLKRRMESGYGI